LLSDFSDFAAASVRTFSRCLSSKWINSRDNDVIACVTFVPDFALVSKNLAWYSFAKWDPS